MTLKEFNQKISKVLDFLWMRPRKIDEKYKKYASFNRRIFASTIDCMVALFTVAPLANRILRLFLTPVKVPLDRIEAARANPDTEDAEMIKILIESGKMSEIFISFGVQMIALIIASAICWKIWSATPGKMLLRMKIVDADTEQNMTTKQILVRSVGYIFSSAVFALGIIWISFNKRRQGWHDKMANTVVIVVSK